MHHRRPGHGDADDGARDSTVANHPQHARSHGRGGSDPGVALVKTLAAKAWKSNRVKSGMLLWLVGLFFMILAPGLRTVTPEMKEQYEMMVVNAANMPEFHDAYANYALAQEQVDDVKVWFWRFREPFRTQVRERQVVADKWHAEMERLDAVRERKMQEAKAFVGLWSDFGMAEVRARFWGAFDKGKVFAQQQTFYHLIVRIMTARDEDIVSTVLNWVFVALTNFTTGLLGALFYFVFSLVNMVVSYQPDPLSALAFIVLGAVGATSVIASYLFAMYGMVASGMYVVGKVLVRDALEQGQRQRLRQGRHF